MALSASEIRKQVREKKYKNLDYKGIDSKKEQISSHWDNETKWATENPEESSVINRAKEAERQYNDARNSNTANADTYEYYYQQYKKAAKDYKDYYKGKKKEALKEQLKSFGNIINPFDKVNSDDAKNNLIKYQNEYEKYNDKYDSANDVYNEVKMSRAEERQEKANTALNDKDVSNAVKQIYYFYQQQENFAKDAAQNAVNKSENGNNNNSAWIDYKGKSVDIATGKKIEANNRAYEKAVKQLKDKGYSEKEIDDMLDVYTQKQNKLYTEKISDTFEKMQLQGGTAGKLMSNIASVGATLNADNKIAVAEDILKGIQAKATDEYVQLDNYSKYKLGTNVKSNIRQQTSKDIQRAIADNGGSEKKQKFAVNLYNATMSMADNLARDAVTKDFYQSTGKMMAKLVTYGTMASEVAVSTAQDSNARGNDAFKSSILGIVGGVAEIITEEIGIDELLGSNNLDAKYILKSTLSEGTEEVSSDLINLIADLVVSGDRAEVKQNYQQYINRGLSKKEAYTKAVGDFAEQVLWDFAGGAMSGGLFSATSAVNFSIAKNQTYSNIGSQIRNSKNPVQNIKDVVDTGLNSKDKKSKAYRLANKIQSELEQNAYENNSESLDYTQISDSRLGILQTYNETEALKEKLQSEVKDENTGKVINKIISGERIDKKDTKIIKNDKEAINALNDNLGINFTAKDITSDFLNDLSYNIANGQTRNYTLLSSKSKDTKPQKAENATDLTGRASNVSTVRKSQIKINVTSDQVPTETYNIPVTAVATGKTAYISSTKPVTIRGNEVTLNTAIGEVNYSDVNIPDNDTRVILDYVAENDKIGDTGANTIYRNFNKRVPTATAEQYVQQADLIYQAGLANDTDFSTYINSHPQFKNSALVLGEGAENIYRSAQTDRQAFDKAQQALKEAKSQKQSSRKGTGSYKNETATDSDIEEVLKTLADVTGYDYTTTSDTKSNGHIIHNIAETYISNETGKEYQTAIHENVHYVKEHNAEGYKNLRNAVLGWYKENKGNEKFNDIKQKYADVYIDKDNPMTTADIEEELVADGIAAIFTTDEGVEQFAEYVAKKSEPEKKSIVQAFKELVTHIVDTIKKALSRGNLTQYQKEYLEMEKEQAEHIRTLFLDSLDKASENYKSEQKNNTVENSVKKSLNVIPSNEDIEKNISIVANMKNVVELTGNEFAKGKTDLVTQVSNYYDELGNIVKSKYGNVVINRSGIKSSLGHGIGRNKAIAYKSVPAVIENGYIVGYTNNYEGKNYDRAVFSAPISIANSDFLVAVVVNINKNSNEFYLHEAFLVNKKEADSSFKTGNSQKATPSDVSTSIFSILRKIENVKKSLDVDSEETERINNSAIEHFGRTYNWNETGYVLTNGARLDFSGRNEGARGGYRSVDHRDIWDAYPENMQDELDGTSAMIDFMRRGNIRIMSETNGINLTVEPTKAQEDVLDGFISKVRGEITLDIDDAEGNTLLSVEYPKGTYSKKIFNDINKYFEDGTEPYISETARFRYSKDVDSDYSYEMLISKPDMPITVIDDSETYIPNKKTRSYIINEAIERAKKFGKVNENGNAVVHVKDIKTDIIVPKTAMQHSLDRRLNVNSHIVLNLGNILKNSIKINELIPRFDNIEKSYVLVGIAKNYQNEPYVVTFVVNKFTNELTSIDVMYSVNAKTEPAGSLSPQVSTPATGSTISISDLLDYVNNYYPDILSEDVLKHYGYKSRPEGKLGESALYSKDVDTINDLKRENKKLKEANELLRHEFELTGGLETSLSSATNIGRHIKDTYNSSLSGAEIGRDIKAMCDRVMQDEYRSYDTLYNEAKAIAKKIVDNKKKEISPENQAVIDDIRSTAVKLSESQKKEVAYYYGSYGNFRRSNLKNINISNDGIPLDIRYKELQEAYPGLFAETSEPDEPIAIVEIVDTLKNSVENDYGYDADELTALVTNDIIEAYFNVGTHKTFADKKQREINLIRSQYSNQIQKIKEQKKKDYQKALKDVADLKGQVRNLKQEHSRALIEMRKSEREKIRDTRERAETRLRIQRTLLKISTLTKQTKKQHIPNNMIDAVKELINAVTFDTQTDVVLSERIRNLDDSFRMLDSKENSQYAYITDLYNTYIKDELDNLRISIQGKPIRDLSLPELKSVEKLIRMTLGSINHMNNMYGYERNKSIEGSANTVKDQISILNRDKAELGIIDSLKYGSMKPEYFFEYLGSDELLERYKEVRKGEDTWAVTISDAKKSANEIREKYGWKDWDYKSKTEYKTMYNETLNLNLGQMMGIYAMSLREQTRNHLLKGGFQFTKAKPTAKEYIKNKGKKVLDSRQHHLTIFDISSISNMLTLEQREYVRDMIEYLSTEMAEKGNEVSRQLYDVELFKEPVYYPAHCAKDFMHKSSTDTIGSRKIINSGMTNATLENAKNPLVLEEFDDVWAGHVDEMAKYNAFAIPLENFDRVFNYQSHDSNEYSSVRAVINDIFGSKATNYINDLLEDLNGGVVREAGSDIADKLTSLFKKNAVFASASVVVQQPSAIGRALCMIDSKYFVKAKITKRGYEELKKYAPVAIIKEMGYFDTNMAQSTVDYLNNPEYTGAKEKTKAFFTDGAYRDEALSYGASKADELTWCHIWNACKAEASEKYSNLTKEEQLQKAGEKFTDVITKTQVYDSVFSRSALMRSKNGVVKMATAFMAEPTTSLNMFVNSLIQAKRGKISKAQAGKVFGSLMAASILNALLQTLVTAGRDDDKDKKYGEKYIAQLLPNFIDNANPLNQIAFVKDIISIFQGYDVSRADMNVFGDFVNAMKNITSENISTSKKVESLAGAIGAFFGLPVKNVMRDFRSAWNIGSSFFNGRHFNETALQENFKGELKEAIVSDDALAFFGVDILPEKDKNQLIYEAIKNGDDEMYRRIADNVSDPDKYIKAGLIENDSRIAKAGTEYSKGDVTALVNTSKELEAEGFDYDLVVKTIKSYANKLNDKEKSSKKSKLYNADDLYNAVNSGNQSTIDEVISSNKKIDMENGKTEEEAEKSIKSSLTTKFKEEYIEANDSQKSEIENKLNKTGLFTDDDYLKWKSSAYNTDTMIEAFESNDTKQIQEYVSGRINAKIEAGMTKDNAISGIKTSITNQYKEKFINGNADTRANIITIMTKTGLYGSRTDVIAWINKYWLK